MSGFHKDGYSVSSFGGMAADLPRIQAYSEALRRVITPESVVVEIGTGSGVMAMHACQLGARRVYAIEAEDAIETARVSAAQNGFADRIVFIHDVSTNVTLPEPGDVLFSDLRGILPLHNAHLETIIDARRRFLKPGGVQIPQRDTLYVAPVSAPDVYQDVVEPWTKNPFGLNMDAGRQWTINQRYRRRVQAEQIAFPPQVWAVLDYVNLTELNYAATFNWTAEAPVTVHGYQVWFDAVLYDEIGYSTAPDQPPMAYGTTFFPCAEVVTLAAGDTLRARVRADNFSGAYTFSWHTQVLDGATQAVRQQLQQSTFFGDIESTRALHMRSQAYQPRLSRAGQIDAAVLQWMAEGQTLRDIAQHLMQQYAAEFPNEIEAMTKAGDMSVKYGEYHGS